MDRIGQKASDFYYDFDKAGRRFYFSRIDGKRIAKSSINPQLVDKIQIKSAKDNTIDAFNQLKETEEQIEKCNRTIKDMMDRKRMLEDRAMNLRVQTKDFDSKGYEDEMSRRKEEVKKAWHDFIFSHFFKNVPKSETRENNELEKLGIRSKKEWKEWLLKNHPDKNPSIDQELVKRVIALGKTIFP